MVFDTGNTVDIPVNLIQDKLGYARLLKLPSPSLLFLEVNKNKSIVNLIRDRISSSDSLVKSRSSLLGLRINKRLRGCKNEQA